MASDDTPKQRDLYVKAMQEQPIGSKGWHDAARRTRPLADDECRALKCSIRIDGQHERIKTLHGKVLDGWHRARLEFGIEPKCDDLPCATDAERYVATENGARRHMATVDRCKTRRHDCDSPRSGDQSQRVGFAQQDAADMLAINVETLRQYWRVKEAGGKLYDRMTDRKVSVRQAYRTLQLAEKRIPPPPHKRVSITTPRADNAGSRARPHTSGSCQELSG